MKTDSRIFDKVYSLDVSVNANSPITPSSVLFFPPAPWIQNINVKAVSIRSKNNTFLNNVPYVTLVNSKNEKLVDNYPAYDLSDGINVGGTVFADFRLRLTNLTDIVTQSSYVIVPGAGGGTFAADTVLFSIIFYY